MNDFGQRVHENGLTPGEGNHNNYLFIVILKDFNN